MVCKERRAVGVVWVFRWSEEVNGRRRQHKDVIGTTKQFPTETAANKEADRYGCGLNENKQCLSLKDIDVWGVGQPLPQSRTTALVEIGAQSKQVVHQELDPNEVAWLFGLQHEDHANPRMAGRSPTPRWNQAEDQERALCDLLPRSPLGVRGDTIQSAVKEETLAIEVLQQAFVKATEVSIQRVILAPSIVRQTLGATGVARGNDGAE